MAFNTKLLKVKPPTQTNMPKADKNLKFIGTNNDLKKEDMDSIIIKVDNERVILTDGTKSTITDLFSGCRVNFLFGAGFSANLLGTLSNNEVIFSPMVQLLVYQLPLATLV